MVQPGPVRQNADLGPHIVIIGMMGVGKSTIGAALAQHLGWHHVDSDADIERLIGRTGRELAETDGVAVLHELEAEVLLAALEAETPSVISAAASTVERASVRAALKDRAAVVRLVLGFDKTIERQAEGGHRRPMGHDELAALAARREPLFVQIEDLQLSADGSPQDLVDAIGAFLA